MEAAFPRVEQGHWLFNRLGNRQGKKIISGVKKKIDWKVCLDIHNNDDMIYDPCY